MKITKKSSSGTGNGVSNKHLPPFIQALKDFEKLIRAIYRHYEKNPSKTFDQKFHLLNNWHNEYKIDLRTEEFPWHLCNGIYVFYNGWNSVRFISKFPLRFKAPTFEGGGKTDKMSIVLTTEISLNKSIMKKFLENDLIPEHIKVKLLQEIKKVYKEKIKTRYKDDIRFLGKEIRTRKIRIEKFKEQITVEAVEIYKMEKMIKKIEKILEKKFKQLKEQ